MRKVFLERNRSVNSVDRPMHLGVDLSSNARLLPYNSTNDILNLNDLYNTERDNCDKYRVILTVNPICSNVLFNTRTEVVRYEGSSACTLIAGNEIGDSGQAMNNMPLNWKQAIRDTEYSHPSIYDNNTPYVYHCGYDIFNNHILRAKDFIYVSTTSGKTNSTFNTIRDFVRDSNGVDVMETVSYSDIAPEKKKVHIHEYDTTRTMYNSFLDNIVEKDGWYGFTNKSMIDIPNDGRKSDITVNKVMNNNKACEMIDLYPDRSLYSFIPKMNRYRHRIEKNWDYCLTYPFAKDYDKVNEVCNVPEGCCELSGGSSIRISKIEQAFTQNGNLILRLTPMFKHNVNVGDIISLYYLTVSGKYERANRNVMVSSIGKNNEDKNVCFSIRFSDLPHGFSFSDNVLYYNSEKVENLYYKKVVANNECQYYFRKFKKITNSDGEDLVSAVNKLAYGENIYGDRIAEVVFTDTVDVEGLTDHNGRPLSEIFFTVIKRNKGHEKWYDEGNTTDDEIEFSHCFGKVTSGLDLGVDCTDYNVRKLHNVDFNKLRANGYQGNGQVYTYLERQPKAIQDDITIDNEELWENGLYGDIVEFNPIECTETVLEVVMHRFNTAQRETSNIAFGDVLYDSLESDDHDNEGFVVVEKILNKLNNTEVLFNGNINPEGYFYNPFTRIKLRDENDVTTTVIGTNVNYKTDGIIPIVDIGLKDIEGNTLNIYGVKLSTFIKNEFIKGDIVGFYNILTKQNKWLTVYNCDEYETIFISDEDNTELIEQLRNKQINIIKTSDGVPAYATYLPNNRSYVWRSVYRPSELGNDSDIANRPFANGCYYIHQNINFFLRRQDPRGAFGLLENRTAQNKNNPLNGYKIWGWDPVDLSEYIYADLLNKTKIGDICN